MRERYAAAGAAWLTRALPVAQSHVPGREAIDLAFDKIIDQARLSALRLALALLYRKPRAACALR